MFKIVYNVPVIKILIQTHNLLIRKKLTISVAESCTGGLLSNLLTDISGSSNYFKIGIVAYSNEIKTSWLRVAKLLIIQKGAVSKEVALKLAKSIRKLSHTNLGLAITGIAGPTGATKQKPIGLVYIAISDSKKTVYWKFNFKGNRGQIRSAASFKALELLKEWIS
jgi:nicotinamide-nucleotide amidase